MRVLLIEDDSATAQSIELMLQSEGFNVYTTDLGEEGVDLGKLYDYDIILLDLNLPDMSGYEVLRTLRVTKVKTPILILSGFFTLLNTFLMVYALPWGNHALQELRLEIMTQSISQLVRSVEPPFDHAVTWSASISCCA